MKIKIMLAALILLAAGCTQQEAQNAYRQSAQSVTEGIQEFTFSGKSREAEPAGPIQAEDHESARYQGQEGTAWLVVKTNVLTGPPQEVKLGRTSGLKSLDDAAIAAAKRHRFRPALSAAGMMVESEIDVPVDFYLQR
ncbi:hypothetical protein A7P92_08825 [Eikenella corrodens]|uniref:TonB family protein n=1 Tax=Eikenella corrodens TaxID=539 RepID=UPI0007D0962C|nr:TonB family protein [Eikenella corrodens]OAM22852.1 hypothetical protein A7P92_08825 [Eikenella corrodens]